MPHCIAWLFEPLLELLFPASGRHRAADARRVATGKREPTGTPPRCRSSSTASGPGHVGPLACPSLLSAGERRVLRLQRHLQRALWLASHGIDAGPRWIRGAEMAS